MKALLITLIALLFIGCNVELKISNDNKPTIADPYHGLLDGIPDNFGEGQIFGDVDTTTPDPEYGIEVPDPYHEEDIRADSLLQLLTFADADTSAILEELYKYK